jgi:hypothetical protein
MPPAGLAVMLLAMTTETSDYDDTDQEQWTDGAGSGTDYRVVHPLTCQNCGAAPGNNWFIVLEGQHWLYITETTDTEIIVDRTNPAMVGGEWRGVNCGSCGHRWLPEGYTYNFQS